MNFSEAQAFEYSVHCINEIIENKKLKANPFEVVWQTSIGLVTGNTVKYSNYDSPVLSLNLDNEYYGKYVSDPTQNKDIFSLIRHAVYDNFSKSFYEGDIQLIEQPNLLLQKLLELSKVKISNDIEVTNYETVWNLRSLDSTINLDFTEGIKILSPVSLISKN